MVKQNTRKLVFGGVAVLFAVAIALFAATGQMNDDDRPGLPGLFGGVAHAATTPTPNRDVPSITSLTGYTTNSITVNWEEADDADAHWVYSVKSDGSDGSFMSVPPASSDVTSHSTTIKGLDDGTEYWFAVLGSKSPSEVSPKDWFSWSGWAKGATLAAGIVSLGQNASVVEGGTANITVTTTVAPNSPMTVNYVIGTDDDDATVDGDADDYTGNASGSITIAAGTTQGVIPVVINDDSDIDDGAEEILVVTISLPDESIHRLGGRTSATVTIKEGVCDRTAQVQTVILRKLADVSDCARVTDSDLSGITRRLGLQAFRITELKARDFRGLTGLQSLWLSTNSLTTLPEDVFDGLTSLTDLKLHTNSLTSLPEDVFDGLTSLQRLSLERNSLTTLPGDVFDGLASLTALNLHTNSFATLPQGVLDGLTGLNVLYLALNPGSPFTFTAELEQTQANEFKVKVSDSAPFDMTVSLSATGGNLSSSSVVVPGGSSESPAFTATPAGADPVTVSIRAASFPANGVFTGGVRFFHNGIQTNISPVADAGADQTANPGAKVTLDGSGSSDADGNPLTYAWTQTAGTTVTLSSTTTANPTFTAPTSTGTLTFRLTVTDNHGAASATDNVTITVNTPPVADAGADQTVNPGAMVTLDGSGSSDSDGDTLTYAWTQTAGTTVTLSSTTAASPTFTVPNDAEDMTFQLTVTDIHGASATDDMTITVNTPPVANAGDDQTVNPGATVTLDGSGSTDADEDTLTYAWSQTEGTTVTLSSKTASGPTFTAPNSSGSLTFQLTVTDTHRAASAPDDVTITVDTPPPSRSPYIRRVGGSQNYVIGSTTSKIRYVVNLDGFPTNRVEYVRAWHRLNPGTPTYETLSVTGDVTYGWWNLSSLTPETTYIWGMQLKIKSGGLYTTGGQFTTSAQED